MLREIKPYCVVSLKVYVFKHKSRQRIREEEKIGTYLRQGRSVNVSPYQFWEKFKLI